MRFREHGALAQIDGETRDVLMGERVKGGRGTKVFVCSRGRIQALLECTGGGAKI